MLARIGGYAVTAVLTLSFLIALAIVYFAVSPGGFWVPGIVVAGFLMIMLLTAASHCWPPLEFRHSRWRLSDVGLEIHRGVFWKHQISVPAARVQHVDVAQGPLQRSLGIGSLVVHTAGTANAHVRLDGLGIETARELRDELVKQREMMDVV